MKDLIIKVPDEVSEIIETNRKEAQKEELSDEYEKVLVIGMMHFMERMKVAPDSTKLIFHGWLNNLHWEA